MAPDHQTDGLRSDLARRAAFDVVTGGEGLVEEFQFDHGKLTTWLQ